MTTPTRSSINEANRHLQALYQQVDQLTAALHERNQLLQSQQQQQQHKIAEITKSKDSQISDIQNSLEQANIKTDHLEKTCAENLTVIDELRRKEKIYDQIVSFQPSLERLVNLMSQGSPSLSSDSGTSFNDGTPPLSSQRSDVYSQSSIRRIAHYHQRRKKQFSISEDDGEITDTEGESSEEKTKRKEVYF